MVVSVVVGVVVGVVGWCPTCVVPNVSPTYFSWIAFLPLPVAEQMALIRIASPIPSWTLACGGATLLHARKRVASRSSGWVAMTRTRSFVRMAVISNRPEMASIAEKHSHRLSYGTGWPIAIPSSSAGPASSSISASAAAVVLVLVLELALAFAGDTVVAFVVVVVAAFLGLLALVSVSVVLVTLAFLAAGFLAKKELTAGAG